MTGMPELLDGQALWDYDEQGRVRQPVAVEQRAAFTLATQRALFAAMAFNPHQRRGPDGKWIKMGGKGPAGGGSTTKPTSAPPTPRQVVDSWVEETKAKHPGVKLDFYLNSAGVGILSRIEVPKEVRGRGTGEVILSGLTTMADRLGISLAATPSGDYGGSVPKLKAWYKKHGFIPNKGRNRNYGTTEDLIRPAR